MRHLTGLKTALTITFPFFEGGGRALPLAIAYLFIWVYVDSKGAKHSWCLASDLTGLFTNSAGE